ncbi:MAG: DEAD/DEAH box helicase [Candidatus Omnitrophica bacterium]|nr:DEAD/DEAH box helicase [Candidatus Omnitrophota bacterium]
MEMHNSGEGTNTMQQSEYSFLHLGIVPRIIEIVHRLKFTSAYPIQYKTIPLALQGKDLIGIAQTGTGKTMSFVIPTVQHLAQNQKSALILVPTRELAIQVNESAVKIAQPFGIKTAVLIGGSSMQQQIRALSQNPRIIIATPGRLIDLLEQRKARLDKVGILVLDEADRMLDMGFQPQIEKILRSTPKERQTLLFSATMPPSIIKMTAAYMKFPVQVEIAPSGTAAEGVTHELFIVRKEMKKEILGKLLEHHRGSILLFCRTKIGTKKLARVLRNSGHKAAEIHSDRTLSQRKEALEGFKRGRYRILVATDVAARGIDVIGIEVVINFDLPDDAENYVHRIGRTGRAGRTGHAISIATPDQRTDVQKIEGIIKKTLPISKHADVESASFAKPQIVFSSHRGSRGRRGSFRRRR